jgi:hypothetical protein
MIMSNPSSEFRDRLLDSQSVTAGLREEYRKEMQSLTIHKLSPRARVINAALLLIWVVLAMLCVRAGIVNRHSPKATFDWWINLSMYFVVFILLTFGGVRNIVKGEHTWKAYFNVAGMFYTAAGVTVTLVLIRGLRTPHDPASTFGAVYALVFLVVSLGWGLQGRIDASLLTTREGMLRIESRLADLADRLPK